MQPGTVTPGQASSDAAGFVDATGQYPLQCIVPLNRGVYASVAATLTNSGTPFSSPKPIKISYEDIEDELKFWETFVVCYVLGDNPPLHVIEAFV